MKVVVTGAAGFIGFHASRALMDAGADVVGVDSLNDYYDPSIKRDRLAQLRGPRFVFHAVDIADLAALRAAAGDDGEFILHLAAQAGVRYSLENPFAYERSNLAGHLNVLEYARALPNLRHLVYASSSSVYGERTDGPFRESDRCDSPASLYAATKRSCELMSEAYARLYGIAQTGLRFFTVYGPFGRPDMAYWSFTEKILKGETLSLYNHGRQERDFTHIADVAPVFPKILALPPAGSPPHKIYNLGNNKPATLARFVAAIEKAAGRSAQVRLVDRQAGDVSRTFADIAAAERDFGFRPTTDLEEGLQSFVDWLRAYRRL